MAQLMSHPVRRQVNNDPDSPDYCPVWACDETAVIIKWVVVGVVFVAFLTFILGGHWHAKRRMAKGLPPLAYHRWMVNRGARARFPLPAHGQPVYDAYRPGYQQSYPMENYGYVPPPPAYHESEAAPVYTPPSKVNPDQSLAPPQGPPPAGYNPHAGSSNVYELAQPPRAASPFNNNSNR